MDKFKFLCSNCIIMSLMTIGSILQFAACLSTERESIESVFNPSCEIEVVKTAHYSKVSGVDLPGYHYTIADTTFVIWLTWDQQRIIDKSWRISRKAYSSLDVTRIGQSMMDTLYNIKTYSVYENRRNALYRIREDLNEDSVMITYHCPN